MKKDRTRFDAIAEELADPKPEPKPARKKDSDGWNVTAEEMLRRRVFAKPNAYISVQGQAHPVMDWQMTSSMNYDREAEFFGMAYREPSHTVEMKLPGRVVDLMRASLDSDVILVIVQPEPLYYRLRIRDVKWTKSARDEYTTVEAICIEVS